MSRFKLDKRWRNYANKLAVSINSFTLENVGEILQIRKQRK